MNTDTIAGKWEQFKGAIQKQWGKLTNDQLDIIKGDSRMLAGQVQEAYGIAREEAESQVKTWESAYKTANDAATKAHESAAEAVSSKIKDNSGRAA